MTQSTNLAGKTALVTGASSGIGFETAVVLARMGAEVVLVARDPTRGATALHDVRRRSGSARVSLCSCDFASQASIRKFAAEFRERHKQLHILVNNAGGVSNQRKLTGDGIEQTFAVNHLGYFMLSLLLLELLERSAPARIVNVASLGHVKGTLDFDDLGFARGGYSAINAYNRSKLANILFTRDLAERLRGTGVTVTALNPGLVATNIWRDMPLLLKPVMAIVKRYFMLSAAEAAERVVYLSTSAEVEGKTGGYFDKDIEVEPAPLARQADLARRLWDTSLRLTGLAEPVIGTPVTSRVQGSSGW